MKGRATSYSDYFKGKAPRSLINKIRGVDDDEEDTRRKYPELPTYSRGTGRRYAIPEKQTPTSRSGPRLSIPERQSPTARTGPKLKYPEKQTPAPRKGAPQFNIPEKGPERMAFSKTDTAARAAAIKRRLLKKKAG